MLNKNVFKKIKSWDHNDVNSNLLAKPGPSNMKWDDVKGSAVIECVGLSSMSFSEVLVNCYFKQNFIKTLSLTVLPWTGIFNEIYVLNNNLALFKITGASI